MPLLIFYVNDENSSDDTAAFYLFAHEESETDGWYSWCKKQGGEGRMGPQLDHLHCSKVCPTHSHYNQAYQRFSKVRKGCGVASSIVWDGRDEFAQHFPGYWSLQSLQEREEFSTSWMIKFFCILILTFIICCYWFCVGNEWLAYIFVMSAVNDNTICLSQFLHEI